MVGSGTANWGIQTTTGYYNSSGLIYIDASGQTGILLSSPWVATQDYYYLFVAGQGIGTFVTDIILLNGNLGNSTYEPHKSTSAICPVTLRSVSDSIRDTFDFNSGKHTKNCSDVVNLYGNSYTWIISTDFSGFKSVYINPFFPQPIPIDYWQNMFVVNCNNKVLSILTSGTFTQGDQAIVDINEILAISISDSDSGWLEAWDTGTSFTGLTWANLIKAYMNGWKLTTANTNVANCVWTGIASGTTQSAGSGYTYVTTTVDVGYTPYRLIYQLATPVITYYPHSILKAYSSGTILCNQEIQDWNRYTTACYIEDETNLISSLGYVNKIDPETGVLSPISVSTCTVHSSGLYFTSTALSSGNYVEFGYVSKTQTTNPSKTYSYGLNMPSAVEGNARDIEIIDKRVESLEMRRTIKSYSVFVKDTGLSESFSSLPVFICPEDLVITSIKMLKQDSFVE